MRFRKPRQELKLTPAGPSAPGARTLLSFTKGDRPRVAHSGQLARAAREGGRFGCRPVDGGKRSPPVVGGAELRMKAQGLACAMKPGQVRWRAQGGTNGDEDRRTRSGVRERPDHTPGTHSLLVALGRRVCP